MTQEEKEYDLFDKISFITGYQLHLLEEASEGVRWRHMLKKKGTIFYKELEKTEAMSVAYREALQGDQNDLHNSYIAIENIVNCMMNLKNDNQRQYFNDELETLVKKYNLIDNE